MGDFQPFAVECVHDQLDVAAFAVAAGCDGVAHESDCFTFQGVALEDYKKNITEIIDKAQAANIKVMILTSTMIGEDPEKDTNKKLIPYNDFLRQIAKEKNCLLADLSKDMHEQLKKMPDEPGKARMFGEPKYQRNIKNKLTTDGCHMNKLGNIMMAKGVLRTFGLSEEKIAAAEKSWLEK